MKKGQKRRTWSPEQKLEIVHKHLDEHWCSQFKKKFNELYGEDVGIDQQQYKIIEEMNQRIISVDWELIQRIEEGKLD